MWCHLWIRYVFYVYAIEDFVLFTSAIQKRKDKKRSKNHKIMWAKSGQDAVECATG